MKEIHLIRAIPLRWFPDWNFHTTVSDNKTFLLTAKHHVKGLGGSLPTTLCMTFCDSLSFGLRVFNHRSGAVVNDLWNGHAFTFH